MGDVRLRLRQAVRAQLADLHSGDVVLVALSGGADSLALAAATAAEAQAGDVRAGAVIVDHDLQADSATVASKAADQAATLGLHPVEVVSVSVDAAGLGPEANARAARYDALTAAAQRADARAVLLAHTLDDQAETVLLGLSHGSGARSLAGMAPRRGLWRRPFLAIRREDTVAACTAWHLQPWQDPHNDDSSFARVRLRREVMPALHAALGTNVSDALARTADRLRDDDEALTQWARRVAAEASRDDGGFDVTAIAAVPAAVRHRVLRQLAVAAGVPARSWNSTHLTTLDRLITAWHGQGPAALPAGVVVKRDCGRLYLSRPAP